MGDYYRAEFECRWPADMPNPGEPAEVARFIEEQEALDPFEQSDYIQARLSVLAELDRYAPPRQRTDEWEFGEVAPGVVRLFFSDNGASYGTYAFNDLAYHCRGAGIAYRMADGGGTEHDGVTEMWEPGMESPVERDVLNGGDVALDEEEIIRLIDASANLDALRVAVAAFFHAVNLFPELKAA